MKETKYPATNKLWSIRRRRKNKTQLLQDTDHIPGTLVYTGESTGSESFVQAIVYNEEEFSNRRVSLDELATFRDAQDTLWLNVVGLHDTETVQKVGEAFGIHSLVLEDVLNIEQRPVFEEYDAYFFIAAKMLHFDEQTVRSEQLSMVVGDGFIITFQERTGDVFENVRKRLQSKSGIIRTRKSDYLAFALLDVIVDHYMDIVDLYGDEINEQEIQLLSRTDKGMLAEINQSKQEVNFVRKYVRPLRDAIVSFQKSPSRAIEKRTRPFLKDLMGHIGQVAESIELYRDNINDNLNTYHLSISNKLNDILKVLTIFSVIFIPLTFLAGIYGMNFDHMPELHYQYAYPVFIGVLVVVAGGMIIIFKKRGWL